MKKIKTWNFHFFKLSIIHQNEQSDPDPYHCTRVHHLVAG